MGEVSATQFPFAISVRTAVAMLIGIAPIYLYAGLGAGIADELTLTPFEQGAVVTAHYLCGAAASLVTGWLTERVGVDVVLRLGVAASCVFLLTLATAVHSYPALIATIFLAGASSAAIQLACNTQLSREIPPRFQGFAFGIKQAAVPFAGLCAGFAVPVVALTLGWRWVFGLAALLAICCLRRSRRNIQYRNPTGQPLTALLRNRGLGVVVIGGTCAAAATTAMAMFFINGALNHGLAPSHAGVLLGVASATAIASRLAMGRFTDGGRYDGLRIATGLLTVGAAGLTLLISDVQPLFTFGALLAFGSGWAWPGILIFAVAHRFRDNPGIATGLLETGHFIGSAAGPIIVGAVATTATYTVVWLTVGGLMLSAALLLTVGEHLLRTRRSPVRCEESPTSKG